MKCLSCGLPHRGWVPCAKAKLVVHTGSSQDIGSSQPQTLSEVPQPVVNKMGPAAVSRHGKYADVEKRKAYRREWMRKKRG